MTDHEILPTDCIDRSGTAYPEHDYSIGMNPVTCMRCGAEAWEEEGDEPVIYPGDPGGSGPDYDGMGPGGNWEDREPFEGDGYDPYFRDRGAVSGEYAFKGLATFVMGGLLYLTYWTSVHMMITEFLLLTLFDIFIFLSWSRAYARTQIRTYDLRPEQADEDPGEL